MMVAPLDSFIQEGFVYDYVLPLLLYSGRLNLCLWPFLATLFGKALLVTVDILGNFIRECCLRWWPFFVDLFRKI